MRKTSLLWKMVLLSGLISCRQPVDDETDNYSAKFSGSSADATLAESCVGERPPTLCGQFGKMKDSFSNLKDEIMCEELQEDYIANAGQWIGSRGLDTCCECFFPGTICPPGQKLIERSRCTMMIEDFRQRFEDAIANGVSAIYCPTPNAKDLYNCCEQDPAADTCPDGLVCEDESGKCVECKSSGDCLEEGAQVCVDNTCVECSQDKQCSDGQVCQDHACVDPECTNSADCPRGEVCGDDGQCVELPESCAEGVAYYTDQWLCDARSLCVDWELRYVIGCEDIPEEMKNLRVDCNPCPEGQRCGRKDSKCYEVECVPRTCEEAALAGDVPDCPLFCQSVNDGCGSQMNCCEYVGPPESEWDAWRERVLVLFNEQRAVGATCGDKWFPASAPLVLNEDIHSGAQGYALQMLSTGKYGHDPYLPPGLTENIGWDLSGTPEKIVEAWLASPGHCAAIMNDEHRYAGVGFARFYWVSRFSR